MASKPLGNGQNDRKYRKGQPGHQYCGSGQSFPSSKYTYSLNPGVRCPVQCSVVVPVQYSGYRCSEVQWVWGQDRTHTRSRTTTRPPVPHPILPGTPPPPPHYRARWYPYPQTRSAALTGFFWILPIPKHGSTRVYGDPVVSINRCVISKKSS